MGCVPASSTKTIVNANLKSRTGVCDDELNIRICSGNFIQEYRKNPCENYNILALLGEGSYGKVYRVQDKKTRSLRAMKLIKKNSKNLNSSEEEKILKEINILKSLDHPNIIKIYEFFNTEEEYYIISELCQGGELFDRIIKSKYLSEAVAANVMKQLLSVIQFCHKNKVIHRDLKPENILIENFDEKEKDYFSIQVIDFGTGEIFKDNVMLTKQIGTPYYTAPEVLNNQYNEKCDLWSCGVIMYILLCGCPPFFGKNDEEIFSSVKSGAFSFNHNVWSDVSEAAKDLIMQLLELDINKRLSAEKALKHKWFSYFNKCLRSDTTEIETDINNKHIKSPNILNEALTNMKNFRAESKLQQATLYFMVQYLVPIQEKIQLRKIFMKMDENNDGRLTKEELMKCFKKSKMIKCTDKELQVMMSSIDFDKNGFIEYQEFLTASFDIKKLLTDENLKRAFDMFDKDNSGRISAEEIKQVLGVNNEHNTSIWKKIINSIDSDGDGEISFEEFKVMMYNLLTSL